MKSWDMDGGFVLRLDKGEELIKVLSDFCNQHKIKAGWVWGIGGLASAKLAYYEQDKKTYKIVPFHGFMELVSLSGNVGEFDGKPALHLHASLSDKAMHSYGGHLQAAVVGATCEILLRVLPQPLNRALDSDTGLKLLF